MKRGQECPTRKLSDYELRAVNSYLESVRLSIKQLSGDDSDLLYAIRRKIAKELTYDERTKPIFRNGRKSRKFGAQQGICDVGQFMPFQALNSECGVKGICQWH